MLKNLRIGKRLGIAFGAILFMTIASVTASVLISISSQQQMLAAVTQMNERVASANSMIVAQLEAAASVGLAGTMTNGRDVKNELVNYKKALQKLQAEETALQGVELENSSRELLDAAIASRKRAEPLVGEAMEMVIGLAGEEGARILRTKVAPEQTKWTGLLKQLATNEQTLGQAHIDEIKASSARRQAILAAVLLGVVGAGVAFSLTITRSVTRPLADAARVASSVAQGNLNVQIKVEGNDEAAVMLSSLQSMARQLSDMVSSVRQATTSISLASEEISRGNMDLSDRTERQAAALQETSASLSDLLSAVSMNTDNADSARQLAEHTAQSVHESGVAMGEVKTTMASISESSKRIADIIGVIDAIAFQTNILALNAAVEAARAGEQGRGFAVVASEVRALAQRVATAAAEVRGLITESVQRVDFGSKQVSMMGVAMDGLLERSQKVKGLVNEIASASASQRESITSVDETLRSVDGTTQQNAALVEQVTAAAKSMVGQTQSLGTLVGRFRTAEMA